MLDVCLLGTGGMMPLPRRWLTALMTRYNGSSLAAADEVIITVNPQLLAMMGLQDFLKTVKKIRARVNDRLSVAGILLTMYDARTNLCKVITEPVRDTFEGQIRIFESRRVGLLFGAAY